MNLEFPYYIFNVIYASLFYIYTIKNHLTKNLFKYIKVRKKIENHYDKKSIYKNEI